MYFATDIYKDSEPATPSCRHFVYLDILLATKNFDETLVIGHGGFGKVYKGKIMDGSTSVVAAIKRLDTMSGQGAAEFWAEVETLSMLRHCNLVSLIGYCNYKKELILVYEYISNGTLEDHLHKLGTPLNWLQRLKICIGAGRGLHYLHTGTGIESGVIHRDVKSSNILLHESWAAKISDFGLSKISPTNQPKTYVNTLVKGTFGYLDPDYFTTGKLTRKSDVYAFGVVMLELLCRKRALDRSLDEEQWNLARWVQESIKEGNLKQIVDSDIRAEIAPKCLKEFVRIAERCLYTDTKQRLTMAQVLVSLENVLILQEKYNDSLQRAGRTLLGRMINMLPFFSDGGNSAHGYSISTPRSEGDISSCSNLKSFTFSELKKATRNFRPDSLLGEGGFGYVFKGWINEFTLLPSKPGSGIVVAVKKLKPEGFQGHKEWLTEVTYLGKLQHPNLVKLIGYCMEGDNRLLVYEYCPKGSLENHLFKRRLQPLSWAKRLKVAIGAARGLAFLHDAKDQVIYRDFKASSILLDSEFNAKLSDFGLVKAGPTGDRIHVSTRVMGTHGYAAPEYIARGRLTAKSDVYSFGVVLLELLSGRRAVDKDKVGIEQDLVEWTKPYLRDGWRLSRIMDTKLEGEYPQKNAYNAASLASQCLSIKPKTRPRMSEVLASLEKLEAAKNASKHH